MQRFRCSTLSFSGWDDWVLHHPIWVGLSVKKFPAAAEDWSATFSIHVCSSILRLFLGICRHVQLCGIFWTDWYQSYVCLISVCHPKCYDILKYAMTIEIQMCFPAVLDVNCGSVILLSAVSSHWPVLLFQMLFSIIFMH